jgi:hypothetical protein
MMWLDHQQRMRAAPFFAFQVMATEGSNQE